MESYKPPVLNDKICFFNRGKDMLVVLNNCVYVNGNPIKVIDYGVDGIVYQYQNYAIKLYHDDIYIKDHLTKENIKKLSSISMNHIVLPIEGLQSDDSFNPGFVMNYLDMESEKNILLAQKDHLIEQVKEVEEEAIRIGKEHFFLSDLRSNNYFYNGNLYLLDPDGLIYDEKADSSQMNITQFAYCFMRDILLNKEEYHLSEQDHLSLLRKMRYIYRKKNYSSLSQFLEEEIQEETMKQHYLCHIKK